MKKLYTPFRIGNVEIKNRIFMAPMSTGYENMDGTISGPCADYWIERAKGGTGLIIVDCVGVDKDVPYQTPNTLSLGSDEFIESFKAFNDEVHKYGAKVFPQIAHFGAESCSWMKGVQPVGPSAYHNAYGAPCRELDLEEIPAIIEKYGDAALRAKKAGCDGIEFHCAHAYMLPGAFLSSLRNKRTDEYGGDLDARARLTIECLKNIREKVGEDFPILMRVSGDERVPGGNTLDDLLYIAPKFVEAGVNAFEVSGGNPYEAMEHLIPCHYSAPGVNVKEAEALRKIVDVPVLVVGKINDAKYAEFLVENDRVDGVVMGRPLLADPDLVNKAREGNHEDIIPCASCGGGCITRTRQDPVAHCVINPALGREKEWAITPAERKKKVVVIGAGPAGLMAARVSALRGHSVTLLEKDKKVGGQINLAAIPPNKQEISKWVRFLATQVDKLGVDLQLNTEATAQSIQNLSPDAVIVATGSNPFVPPIKGIEEVKVVTGHQILKGEAQILGGKVLVIGGGLVGCETAHWMLENARGAMDLEIVEMIDGIVKTLCPNNRKPLMKELDAYKVKFRVSSKVAEIVKNGETYDVTFERDGQKETISGYNHIVFCSGAKSNDTLSEALSGLVPEVHVIGDAQKVDMARNATETGYDIARRI